MSPLSCWIIEDEPPALRRLSKLVDQLRPGVDIAFTTDAIQPAVAALRSRPHPDVIFSDIHLADGNCFDIWEEVDSDCPIIFTTAYDQYSIRAFKVNSIDYLLKPVEENELERALHKLERTTATPPDLRALSALLRRGQPSYRERFLAQYRQDWVPVRVAELRQFYSEDGMTFALSAAGKRYLLDETLDRIFEALDPNQWFRINRSQIVNIEAVIKVQPYFNHRLTLTLQPSGGGDNIVSRQRVKDCKEWLSR